MGFTLDEPTWVAIEGWYELDRGGALYQASKFSAQVYKQGGPCCDLGVNTGIEGQLSLLEGAMLGPGAYTFVYESHANSYNASANYDFVLTIPEPGTAALLGLGLGALAVGARYKRTLVGRQVE